MSEALASRQQFRATLWRNPAQLDDLSESVALVWEADCGAGGSWQGKMLEACKVGSYWQERSSEARFARRG